MPDLIDLLPFLFAAGYVLLRALAGAGKKKQAPPPTALDGSDRPLTPFEQLMKQIEEAVEEQQAEQGAVQLPRETPTVRLPPRPTVAPEPEPEFHEVGGFDSEIGFESEGAFESAARSPHEDHGFGLSSPFSEEAFEQLPRGLDITEHAPGHLDVSPHRPPPGDRAGHRGRCRTFARCDVR